MEITEASWGGLAAAAGTVTGNRYRDNYDAHHLDRERPFAVLADGMGDGPGSAFASRTTVERLTRLLREATVLHTPAALRAAVAAVQQDVRRYGRDHPGLAGCTLTALIGDAAGGAWLLQLGDSRAYRLRHDLLELLTVDHTAAWLGLLHGWFDHDSAQARAARYRLSRYVGHPDAPDPDVLNEALRPGDVYLLCTDGVADQLPYEMLRDILGTVRAPAGRGEAPSPESPAGRVAEAVRRILEATLTAGGADNATAVVLTVPA